MIAIIESPYQLQNVISLFDFLNVCNNERKLLVRDNGNKLQNEQFKEQEKVLDMDFFYMPKGGVKKIYFLLLFLLRNFYTFLSEKEIVFGDARSIVSKPLILLARFTKKKIYLVDDGLYLLSYIKKIESLNCTLYTVLPLLPTNNCKYKIINKAIKRFDKIEGIDCVCFIGQPIVELGFISVDNYIHQLKRVVNHFSFEYEVFRYYVHRSESEEKLKKIGELGFEVIFLDTNLEHHFYKQGAPSGVFLGFYSTALLNIFNAHVSSEFFFVETSLDIPSLKIEESINLAYNALRSIGIQEFEI